MNDQSLLIAILALQGAFAEHADVVRKLGARVMLIRNASQWDDFMAGDKNARRGLILPGGESTAMLRLLDSLSLRSRVCKAVAEGLPVFGTCAGMILLSRLKLMNIEVVRNAYGRQLGSFRVVAPLQGVADDVPMTFIRAPYVSRCGKGVEVLSQVDNRVVAVRQQHMLATAFHPELTADTRVHEFFLSLISTL